MPRRIDEDDLKVLKKIWYKKLKDSGFQDIEDINSPRELLKTWHSNYFMRKYTPDEFEAKASYYRRCSHFLYDYSFDSDRERLVWELHSEGLSFRDIAKRLWRYRLNKDSVNKMVSKLIEIMKRFPVTDGEEGPNQC